MDTVTHTIYLQRTVKDTTTIEEIKRPSVSLERAHSLYQCGVAGISSSSYLCVPTVCGRPAVQGGLMG